MFRRMLTPFFVSHRLLQGVECCLILPRGGTDGGADHQLEELILAFARRKNGGDVLVGDPRRLTGDLVDQGAQRLAEPCVLECSTPSVARRAAISFKDPDNHCPVRRALLVFHNHGIQLSSCSLCDGSAVSIVQKMKRRLVKKGTR